LISLLNDQTNCAGDSISLSVSASPGNGTGPYTYQWQFQGTNISGATTTALNLNSLPTTASGQYTVVIGDGSGFTATRSMNLTVQPTISIDAQPTDVGPVPGDGSGNAYFGVSASVAGNCPCANSTPLTYQWMFNGVAIPGATDPSYVNPGTWMTNGGSYTALVSNTCNGSTMLSSVAKLYVYDPLVTPISGSCSVSYGLLGLYWTNQTPANAFTGSPTWTNNDSNVSFDWGAGGPFFSPYDSSTNNFTIRWLGQVQPYYPNQIYTFYTKSDDGVRLWVNGRLLIDQWVPQSATAEWSGSITLGSSPVDLILEYFEATGNASVSLSWDSLSVNKAIVPDQQLCAADPGTGVPPLAALTVPTNNSSLTIGSPVTLTASVTPEEATVSKVEYYSNATNLLATAASSPYTKSWTPPATGAYNLSARVYYNSTHTLNTPVSLLNVNPIPVARATNSIVANPNGSFTIRYSGGAAVNYVLWSAPAVSIPLTNWTAIATNSGTLSSSNFVVQPSGAAHFYRISSRSF
jgi:hypothetical protein